MKAPEQITKVGLQIQKLYASYEETASGSFDSEAENTKSAATG